MSRISINVEFLAGTSILQAVEEAKEKACFWDVAYVCFEFNGVRMSVSQRADIQKLVDRYGEASSGDSKFRSVYG